MRDIFKLLCRIIVDAYKFWCIFFLARVFGNFRFLPCYLPLFPFNLFGLNLEFEPIIRRELFLTPVKTKVGIQSGLVAYEEKDAPADATTNPTKVVAVQGVVTMEEVIESIVPIKDGYSFVRNLVTQLHNQLNLARQTKITSLVSGGKMVYNPRWQHTGTPKKPYEQTLKLGVDDLCITGHYQNSYIYTALHADLAVRIVKTNNDATPGPSTVVTFRNDAHQKPNAWSSFFKYMGLTQAFVELKSSVHWQIRGLNEGWFEKAFVNPSWTLRVYSNANTSCMVGNQVSDVLREVKFDSNQEGQQYFKPKHRQYLHVRQQENKVMEIALDDLSGVPVQLGPGVTLVVLHF